LTHIKLIGVLKAKMTSGEAIKYFLEVCIVISLMYKVCEEIINWKG